ncbi:LEPR-XLL domain-containing protein [Halobacteriaceae archaeon GCM10025711]
MEVVEPRLLLAGDLGVVPEHLEVGRLLLGRRFAPGAGALAGLLGLHPAHLRLGDGLPGLFLLGFGFGFLALRTHVRTPRVRSRRGSPGRPARA